MDVFLSENQVRLFIDYMEILCVWNERMNLTAITDSKGIICKHFLDSLTILREIPDDSGVKIIDIGAGAGFPSMPVKIARPDIYATLLDSLNKRISFLTNLTRELELNGVQCIHGRAEDYGRHDAHRQRYDIAVSRAVANLSVLAEYCLPFIKTGGKFISMKGPDVKDEINDAKSIINILGGEVSNVVRIQIPFTDIMHSLIVVSKLRDTSARFPRKPGKIPKAPIK